jgi:hypothetical protein
MLRRRVEVTNVANFDFLIPISQSPSTSVTSDMVTPFVVTPVKLSVNHVFAQGSTPFVLQSIVI